jgi:hypothetical protein
MGSTTLAGKSLASYAVFMVCNQYAQKYGKAVSSIHYSLYSLIDQDALEAGVRTVAERIVFDNTQKAAVQAHFQEHNLDWSRYVSAIEKKYNSLDIRDFDYYQKVYKFI